MHLAQLIADHYYEVKPSDSIAYTLQKMKELRVIELPVVDKQQFLGIVKRHLLTAQQQPMEQTLHSLKDQFEPHFLFEHQHAYDALNHLNAADSDLMPILSKDLNYLGAVDKTSLLQALQLQLNSSTPGALIVIDLAEKDQALAHIAHLVESENIKIMLSSIREIPDTDRWELTLKVNRTQISALLSTLWRFDYRVTETFNEVSDQEELQDRYQSLMNYLNL